ncbi:MAG: hypothetical protein HQM00_00455 [Magnetococcales bacterium]|nr:hypothetical protein [Magnetococcales bacterium]
MPLFFILVLLITQATPAQSEPLRVERITPKATVRPLEENTTTPPSLSALIRHALARRDRIVTTPAPLPGRVIAPLGERPLMGRGDLVRIHYPKALPVGTTLDLLRPGPALIDPVTAQPLGALLLRLGTARVRQSTPHGLIAEITESLQAIEAGDGADLSATIDAHFTPHAKAPQPMAGRVIHIQDGLDETAAPAVILVSLGRRDRAVQGLTLPLYRTDHPSTPGKTAPAGTASAGTLPPPVIGEAILIQIGERASLALLARSQAPIRRGDRIATP